MEILERFCRALPFSTHLGERRPNLLPQLLLRAVEEDDDKHQVRCQLTPGHGISLTTAQDLVCCRLLAACPMRNGWPAGLPQFLEKLMRVDHLSSNNADLLHGLREIVAMQTSWVFLLVDQIVLMDFIDTCKLLTTDCVHNRHESALVSINIGSAVCSATYPKDFIGSQQRSKMPEMYKVLDEWGAKMSIYFHGPKAARSLYSIGMFTSDRYMLENPLMILALAARVMFFTSRNQQISMANRSRTLDIVLETLDRFQFGIKEFADENPGAIEKVWRNTAGEELNFDARFSAFAVAYKLTSEGTYNDHIEGVLQQLLNVITSEDGPGSMCLRRNALSKAQQLTDALFFLMRHDQKYEDRDRCLKMLHQIVDFILVQCTVCEQPDAEACHKTAFALILLDAISESMKKLDHAFTFSLDYMNLNWPGDLEARMPWLESLPNTLEPVAKVHCRGNLVCARELSHLGDMLRHKFTIVWLQGACTTTGSLSTKEFVLMQKRAVSYNPQLLNKRCQYPADVDTTAAMPPPSLPQRAEGDWRQQIVDSLENVQRQSVTTILNQITQLQDAAKQQNDKITQLMADITSLKLQHESHITGLRAEATSTKEDLELLNKATRFGLEEQIDSEKQNAVKLAATIQWLEQEMHSLQEEQKTDHKKHEESVQRANLEHEQAYNNIAEQVRSRYASCDHC